ncbi:MAG: DUF4145 domain-containing protein, partial [Candidatus Pacebacteria bacterium]|nr:DUF4145 domain-containing protein [Candidatus Paceibacterota bacterium]
QKIDQMQEEKIITPEEAKHLHLTRDVGNFSAHEMKLHSEDKITLCLDIVESLMRNLYVLPENVKSIIH